ncbi:MAG TPA: lamin tail domain-containing protein, partial [Kiritimatiellia bacterium]|nr:lamin tail domain-containing protein [Kiritimatiellia bacterium]
QPPRITLDPAGTNKTVVFDNALSFTVTATDADGLEVALSAGGMPEGAVFAGATNTGTASAAFNWTPGEAQVGSYTVTFSATDDDGTTQTGVKITVRDGSTASDLFISEYIEGSSNNKAVEIFNGTGSGVDLSSYVIRRYDNGSSSVGATIPLSGTLADGEVYVIANSSAGAAILAQADLTSGSATWNGNDVVALAKNDANIDVVGTIGDSADFAKDVTKVRKSTVAEGTTTYDAMEWDDYAVDTTDYLGSHEFGAAGPEAPSFAAIPPQSASVGVLFSLNVSAYASGNPAPAVTLDSSTADAGDYSFAAGTLSFTPSTAGAFDFVFLASNELGTAMATATVTAVAGPVELLAPVVQAASGVDATQFNANWSASAGATGYILDVATNETFSGGGEPPVGGNLMSNAGFETGDSTDWDKFETEYAVVSTDPQEGIYHVTCAATGTRDLMQAVDITGDGVTEYEISYYYKVQAGDGTDVRIWSTWAAGGQVSGDTLTSATYNATADVWTKQTYYAVPQSGANTLNFEVRVYNGATVDLDNFYVGTSSRGAKAAPYVPGYESLDVGNVTTHAVTGLTEGVTYYYRVKAYNASSNSPYSAVTSVVTQASSGEQPDIAGFVVPAGSSASATLTTTTLGKTYTLQYTTDLMANPVVWTDADTEAGGGEITLVDGDPADVARYYRVVEQ